MPDHIRRDPDGRARLRVRFSAEECDALEQAAVILDYEYIPDLLHDAIRKFLRDVLGDDYEF